MQKKQLERYIKEELTPFEAEKVISWIEASDENQKTFSLIKAQIIAKGIRDASEKTIRRRKTYKPIFYWSAAAAILVLLTISIVTKNSFFGSYTNQASIVTIQAKEKAKTVHLPDGSEVTLNAESTISYPKYFEESSRNITLSGEAYFEVVHNPLKPFYVKTKSIAIKVLGTTFNVKAFPNDKYATTVLLSGKVNVLKDNNLLASLSPNERLVYENNTNTLHLNKMNDAKSAISWRQGYLVFDDNSLSQIIDELERIYKVSISSKIKNIHGYSFTAKFNSNSTLQEVLELLKISSDIDYDIQEDQVVIYNN